VHVFVFLLEMKSSYRSFRGGPRSDVFPVTAITAANSTIPEEKGASLKMNSILILIKGSNR
jgi:hypothetical protein